MARYMPGGRVVLSSGEFELSGPIRPDKSHSALMGMGHSTLLRPHTTGFSRLISWDFTNNNAAAEHGTISSLQLLTRGDNHYDLTEDEALYLRGNYTWVTDVHTIGCGMTLHLDAFQEVSHCFIHQDTDTNYDFTGITVTGNNGPRKIIANGLNFVGNTAILIDGGIEDIVAANVIRDGASVSTGYGIWLLNSVDPSAVANRVGNGLGNFTAGIRESGVDATGAYVAANNVEGGMSLESGTARASANYDLDGGEVLHHGDQTVVGDGDGVIVTTPDGSARYRIRVDNNGNVVTDLV